MFFFLPTELKLPLATLSFKPTTFPKTPRRIKSKGCLNELRRYFISDDDIIMLRPFG